MDSKDISLFELLKQAEDNNNSVAEMAGIYNNVLTQKSFLNRRPIAIQFELLPVCNFDCRICYIRTTFDELKKRGQDILRFEDWKKYADEAVEIGVSSITFTGGECTIHPDFKKIYEYAYKKGLQLSMITNGSNINPAILEMFEKYPPSKVFVTLYGMSNDTYERFCGVRAFDKVMNNIELLRSKKINVVLNYTVGKENLCDLDEALYYARDNEMTIFPNNALQVSRKFTADALKREIADYNEFEKINRKHLSEHYHQSFEEYENSFLNSVSVPKFDSSTKGLKCNAARCTFSINWKGVMQPCASIYWHTEDPKKAGGMEKAWQNLVAWADEIPVLEDCRNCIFQKKCHLCTALHYGDTGEYGKVSPRFCFKVLHPEEAEKLQAEYDRKQAEKA